MAELTQETIGWTAVVERAATGDAVAFERIVAAYHADMMRVAFVVTGGDQNAADDAVQSAWAIAWRKLRSLRDPDRIKPWLVAVAANEARRAFQRRPRARVVEIDVATDRPAGPDPDAFADELDLDGAMRRLSADDRSLLALRYAVGLDSTEIGALTGQPAATVRWRLARLIARLRKELADV
jgi:RNA polymerase sigma-70 factor (ECF subfamily)